MSSQSRTILCATPCAPHLLRQIRCANEFDRDSQDEQINKQNIVPAEHFKLKT
jgi:hypothetical protein